MAQEVIFHVFECKGLRFPEKLFRFRDFLPVPFTIIRFF